MDKRQISVILFCTAIILIAFLSYINSIPNPFLFDDEFVIENNKNIRDLANIKYLFSTQYFEIFEERTWRPVTTLFYMLNYKFWGFYAPMWKIVSISIHALNGIFLYLALRRYYDEWTAFFAGAIFVSLPVNSEVIHSFSFIKDPLALSFAIASFALYLKRYFLLSIFTFIFSLLSKEMAVILPVFLISYDIIISGYKGRDLLKRIKDIHIWYWITLFVFLVIYFGRFQNPHGGDEYFGGAFSAWLLNLPLILVQDIGLLFSIWQNVDHVLEPLGIKAVFLWIPLILIISIFAIICYGEKNLSFLFIWMFLCLVPISGIIPLDQIIADRYLYWSSFAFSGIIAIIFFRLLNIYAIPILLAFVLFFITVDFKRSNDWRDNWSLWTATVQDEPKSFRGHYNLANAYFNKGDAIEAIDEVRIAIRLKPDYAITYNTLGFFYFYLKDYASAEVNFKKAVELKPGMAEAYNNLALVMEKKGEREKAIALLKKAIEIKPDYHAAIDNLAKMDGDNY